MREDVTNNISESLAALIELTRSRQNRAEQIFTDVYRKIELCAAVLVALMLEICIITRHLVVKPLLQYGQSKSWWGEHPARANLPGGGRRRTAGAGADLQ